MRRVFVDPASPQRDAIEEAAKWILLGGVVALATDTLYGLAVDPYSRDAVARLFEVKQRKGGRAVPLIAADVDQVTQHLGALPRLAAQLAARFWPGPLTLIVSAPAALARGVAAENGSVGVRVPAHDVARSVSARCGRPITATSANVSGAEATADPDEVEQALGNCVDFLLDTGPAPGGPPSTVIDARFDEPRLVRDGAVPWQGIQEWLNVRRSSA